jgi:hypothetical protein
MLDFKGFSVFWPPFPKGKGRGGRSRGASVDALPLSPVRHSSCAQPTHELRRPPSLASERGDTDKAVGSGESKKQTHLVPDFKGFSSLTPTQSRRSPSFAISLRAVHEPPLQGNRNAFLFPFPKGKGLGVRSASYDTLPVSHLLAWWRPTRSAWNAQVEILQRRASRLLQNDKFNLAYNPLRVI